MKKTSKTFISILLICAFALTGCKVELVAQYDAVILGSGVSAMTAALELEEKGRRVMIVEETAITGGNKRLLSGGVSYLNTESGDSVDSFANDIAENNYNHENFYIDPLVEQSVILPQWLEKHNIDLTKTVQLPGNSIARTLVNEKGSHSGKEMVAKLEEAVKNSTVKMEYNTTINKLELSTKNRYEVSLEKESNVVTVYANTIIFAEDAKGSFDSAIPIRSTSDVEKLTAEEIPVEMTTGMILLERMKVKFDYSGEFNVIDTYNADSGVLVSPILRTYGAMLVNKKGERFVNEMSNSPQIVEALVKQEDQEAYLIYDANIKDNLTFLDEYTYTNSVIEADSIGELAEKTNIASEALYKTTAEYQRYSKKQNDEAFARPFIGESKAFDEKNVENRYYAIKVQPYITVHPAYAYVTDSFEVIKDSAPIQGIYAIGDSAQGVLPDDMLHGTEITYAIVMGQDVARNIDTYLTSFGTNETTSIQ